MCGMEDWGAPAILSTAFCEERVGLPYEMYAGLVQSFPTATKPQITAKQRRQGNYCQRTEVLRRTLPLSLVMDTTFTSWPTLYPLLHVTSQPF